MTHSKHTPGPWTVQSDGDDLIVAYSDGFVRSQIARLYYTALADEHGSHKANARLIAAAPEMLENIRDILKSLTACEMVDATGCEGVSELWIGWLRDIIQKAEGK